jgi:hypothetical protein
LQICPAPFCESILNPEEAMAMAGNAVVRHMDNLKQTFPKRNEDVHSTNMDGESVLLNLVTGRYYSLNSVGALIWEQCSGAHSLMDILVQLCVRFDVSEIEAQGDLLDLIDRLCEEGLIQTERR